MGERRGRVHGRASETNDLSSGGAPVSRDTLSDVLRAVRLRGAVFYYIEGSSPWVAEAPAACDIIPAILPGAEHMIEFHAVVEGSSSRRTTSSSSRREIRT
jgi:hypothetical protein